MTSSQWGTNAIANLPESQKYGGPVSLVSTRLKYLHRYKVFLKAKFDSKTADTLLSRTYRSL